MTSPPQEIIPAHELRAHATRTDMPTSCLRVYLTLLDHRGDNATAWPSVARLAERSGCRERTVQDALGALRRHGWIVPVDNQRRTAEYELHAGTVIARLIVSREPRAAYLERVSKPRPADPSDRTEGASRRTPGCEPSHPSTPVVRGANRRTRGCDTSHPGVRAVAPGGCEPSHPNYSLEHSNEGFRETPTAGVRAPDPLTAPPAQPPQPRPGECVSPRAAGRHNLTVIDPGRVPIPTPDEVQDFEVPDPLRPGEVLVLPGTLDELFADAPSMGFPLVRALRDNGVTSTAELFRYVADEAVRFAKGLGPIRAQQVRQHLAEQWGVTLHDEAQLEANVVTALAATGRRQDATREARKSLRVVNADGGDR